MITNINVGRARDETGGEIVFEFAYGDQICVIIVNLRPQHLVPMDMVEKYQYELSENYYILKVENTCRNFDR